MHEMLDWWLNLNKNLDSQKLSTQEKNRLLYIELSRLHLDPTKWRAWGKQLLENGLDPFPYIYTPGIGTAILAHKEGFDIDSQIPKSIKPLDIIADPQNFDEKKIKEIILQKASKLYRLYQPAKTFDLNKSNPLSDWGVVITNKRRVLGFGEVPDGGEWIVRGKVDCYEMATEGKVSLMIPLAINVESIKKDEKLHDKYISQVLLLLESLGVSFIQFEDFDGESAFRILEWSRQNLHTPVFNDDIEGTAWIILLAKLAAYARYPSLRFKDSLFIFHGGGGAAVGTANFLEKYLLKHYEEHNIPEASSLIHKQFLMTDSAGLLYEGRTVKSKGDKPEFKSFQLPWVLKNPKLLSKINKNGGSVSLKETMEILGPEILGPHGTIFLIGLSTCPDQFTELVIKTARQVLDQHPERKPLPLFIDSCSNPTYKTEILTNQESQKFPSSSPEEKQQIITKAIERIFTAADGRVCLTTGSPMHHPKYMVSQLNNFLGFPAAGLALLNYQLSTLN